MTPATFQNPDRIDNAVQESSPLLGDREQAAPSKKMLLSRNLFGGARALFTQLGCLILLGSVASVMIPNPAGLFSYHPPLQTIAIVLFVQGILTLQPTRSKPDKARGLAIHQLFQIVGLLAIAAGVSIMIANKALHGANHFTSWHGRFGLTTSILFVLQALIGALVAYDPGMQLFGGEAKAKALWKYHRLSGYLILPLSLVTAGLATTSADWIIGHSSRGQRIAMTAGLAIIAIGLTSRINVSKLGIKSDSSKSR